MSYSDVATGGGPMEVLATDPHLLAHPQEAYAMARSFGSVIVAEGSAFVTGDAEVRHVLGHPEIFSSGFDAASIGQIRPLIPLQIDPPKHKSYRRLLDPLFAHRYVAALEEPTRALIRELIGAVADAGTCNFHSAVAEPLPTTVFLELLGLPVSRRPEFIALKDGIIRPDATDPEERQRVIDETGQRIYAVLEDVVAQREQEPRDDYISRFLDAEVDGETLTHNEIIDICYLFFLAGLDTVTASLDCFVGYLAQNPSQRRLLVDDPMSIPHAIEEMLRWETPVQGVLRITTEDTELGGCPIAKGTVTQVMLGSANTDDKTWDDPTRVDFSRAANRHIAFGAGAHRCLGSHLARMELRVALEEWHAQVPDYSLAEGTELRYTSGLRSIDNLDLVW